MWNSSHLFFSERSDVGSLAAPWSSSVNVKSRRRVVVSVNVRPPRRAECRDPGGAEAESSFSIQWKSEFIQRTLQTCVSVWSLFASRSISVDVDPCGGGGGVVCVQRAGGRPWEGIWELFSQYVRTSYMHPPPSVVTPTPVSVVWQRSSHDCGLLVFCRYMTSSTRWSRSHPSRPDPTAHLKLLTSSTADSIGGELNTKKTKNKKNK